MTTLMKFINGFVHPVPYSKLKFKAYTHRHKTGKILLLENNQVKNLLLSVITLRLNHAKKTHTSAMEWYRKFNSVRVGTFCPLFGSLAVSCSHNGREV